ncbi:phage virion morphogenesis protein [Peijinzhouia sedimentorum]
MNEAKAKAQIEKFFKKHHQFFDEKVPRLIGRRAVNYYKDTFRKKAFDGKPWPAVSKKYKPKGGSLMVRSSKLINSIGNPIAEKSRIVIRAGGSKVPYARVHNTGGVIKRAARTETFRRNRSGNRFTRGTTAGRGFTFKKSQFRMPKRQFIGYSAELNREIIKDLKDEYKL